MHVREVSAPRLTLPDERPPKPAPAGNLRERMRAEIRNSRFRFAVILPIAPSRRAVSLAALCILRRGDIEVRFLATLPLGMQLLEKRHAPLASGARTKAIAQLRGNDGLLAVHECHELPLTHTKTQAHVIIGVHTMIVATRGFASHRSALLTSRYRAAGEMPGRSSRATIAAQQQGRI